MSDPVSALRAVSGNDPTSGATGLPNIPQVPQSSDLALVNILSSMKTWMEKATGSGLTGFATKQEMAAAGVVTVDSAGNLIAGAQDMRVPPVPTGLAANGAMTNILVMWDSPVGKYANHAYTEVWSSETDNFTNAVMVGQAGGFVFSHAVGEDSTRYYWIRFVSTSGIKGPFNAVAGTHGQTAQNVNYLIDTLTEAYGSNGAAPFFQVDSAIVVNGVTIPPGIYIKAAFIANGTITTAQIKNATIDSAQITGRLTANQINADQLAVTNGTFSGQLIGAMGTFSGSLSAASGTFRGELQAASGTFAGSLLAGTLDLSKVVGPAPSILVTPGTYTLYVPVDCTSMRVTMVGGGGAGGAGHWAEWDWVGGNGGGGGAGQYVIAAWDNLPVGAAVTVGVGYGGAGSQGAGGAGTESYVNVNGVRYRTAAGGGGGGQGGSYQGSGNHTYQFFAYGGGGAGYPSGESGSTGIGGTSVWGAGGGSPSPTTNGATGNGFGSGGGGGGYGSGRAAEVWPYYTIYSGGNGAGGKVIVEFYNQNAVVLRTEFAGVTNRVTNLENLTSVNMQYLAYGSLAYGTYFVHNTAPFSGGDYWAGATGWYVDGNLVPGSWRSLGGGLIVRYA